MGKEAMLMRMAKASDKEVEQAIILAGVIEDAESGQFPRTIDGEFNEDDPHYFNEDDPAHLKAFFERVTGLSRGLFRVTFGFSTLMNPQNELVDPDLDHLAMHPRLITALKDAETWKARADAMLNVADYEMRKKIIEGRWP